MTRRSSDRSAQFVALLAFAASSLALAHYYRWGQILLSGDAVAHLNIARRVFDSRTPGLSQLGTVWLPLQHLLTIPFILSDFGWSSGIGGAIPSMFGYVLGVAGIYRLVRDGLGSRAAAWVSAIIYGANPNLLYVQTTALNEPLSMGLLVWAVVWFTDFTRDVRANAISEASGRAPRSLVLCALALLANILIRYDGWFNGCVFGLIAAIVLFALWRRGQVTPPLRRAALAFFVLLAIGPAIWFAYNYSIWGNPLEFATGPYSAKGIEERSRRPSDPHHPGWHAPRVAAIYYLRDLTLNMGSGRLLVGPPKQTAFAPNAPRGRWEYMWLPIAVIGVLIVLFYARASLAWLLLWIPLPFYAISIAWGSVPIFIPVWWPFSYYNTRYALELLPAIAVFWGAAAWMLVRLPRPFWRFAGVAAALGLTAASYASIRYSVPICLREVRANGGPRYALDGELARVLQYLPPRATVLMYLGEHGGALQRARVPLRRTINEGNYKQWEAALRNPAGSADYVVAGEGDAVAESVRARPEHLQLIATVASFAQPPVRIYRAVP